MERVRARMAELDVDVLLLSVGPELPYLTGYQAMPLERLTMLVVPSDGDAVLVCPALEAPRVIPQPNVFRLVPWGETADPVSMVSTIVGPAKTVAIGDRTWARFLVELIQRLPATRFIRSNDVVGPIRAIKDAAEIEAQRDKGLSATDVHGLREQLGL